MSSPIGHIRNPAATDGGKAALAAAPSLMSRAPIGFAALDAALAEMRAANVRAIIIEGGDGTVREVISRVMPLWRGAPPPFAILATGNTNLVARKVGRVDARGAARLIVDPSSARHSEAALLKLERQALPALRGFIMGAGAYAAATRLAQKDIGARHSAQVAQTVLRLLRSSELRTPSQIGFGAGSAAPALAARTLVGLTSLQGPLMFGLSPFWGDGEGPIRWLDIASSPPHFALAAPFIAFGRPRRWMRDHYRSGRLAEATLSLDADFVLDGEHFPPGADGLVKVTAAETATFLSL